MNNQQNSINGQQPLISSCPESSFRWMALIAVAGLIFIPACAMPEAMTSTGEHVYSARSPAELDHSTSEQGAVRANYTSDQTQPSAEAVHADYGMRTQANRLICLPRPTQDGIAAITPIVDPQFIPASYEHPHSAAGQSNASGISLVSFTQAEPRIPQVKPSSDGVPQEAVGASGMAEMFPDEYIFDGGDRDTPFHYHAGDRRGLESEDTVAEFTDHTGDSHVQPSNRVAVYAPRFGSVTSVSGIEADVQFKKASGAKDVASVNNVHQRNALNENRLNLPIAGVETRSKPNGVVTALLPQITEKADSALSNVKVDQGAEGRSSTNLGTLEQSDVAAIDLQFLPAVQDTSSINGKVSQTTAQASSVYATFRPQATVGVEDNRKRKGEIRIIKRADRETAQSGDIVTFTIDFMNVGEFPVHDVRVIDNLSPRLEFVADSPRTNRGGDVVTMPNGEGSVTLIFELDDPLEAQAQGKIEFSARVR